MFNNKSININNCILSSFVRSFDEGSCMKGRIHLLSSVVFLDSLKLDYEGRYNDLTFNSESYSNFYVFIICPNFREDYKVESLFLYKGHENRILHYILMDLEYYFNNIIGHENDINIFEKIFGGKKLLFRDNNLLYNSSLFIFTNLCWSTVVLNFKLKGVDVSGGSISKRHVLSSANLLLFKGLNLVVNDNFSELNINVNKNYKNGFLSSSIPLNMYNKSLELDNKLKVFKIKDLYTVFKNKGVVLSSTIKDLEIDSVYKGIDNHTNSFNYIIINNIILNIKLILKNIKVKFNLDKLTEEINSLNRQINSVKLELLENENLQFGDVRHMSNKAKKTFKKERTKLISGDLIGTIIKNKTDELERLNSNVDKLNSLFEVKQLEYQEILDNFVDLTLEELSILYDFILKNEIKNINKFKLNHFIKSTINSNNNSQISEGSDINKLDDSVKSEATLPDNGITVKNTNNIVNSNLLNSRKFSTNSKTNIQIRKYSTNSNKNISKYDSSNSINPHIEEISEIISKYNLEQFNKVKKDKSFNKTSIFFSGLRDILKDNQLNEFEKQLKVENLWIETVFKGYQLNSNLLTNNPNLGFQQINEACKTLEIIAAKNSFKNKFPKCHKLLYNNSLIKIAYSIGINLINKKQNYTWSCSVIGSKILYFLYIKYKNLIEKKKITNEMLNELDLKVEYFKDFDIFCQSIGIGDNEGCIRLGDAFLDILIAFPVNIFSRVFKYGGSKYYNEVKLVFNDENYSNILNNLIIDPFSMPMLCEPVDWSDTQYGGYLNNKETKEKLISGSKQHNHKMSNMDVLYKVVNFMSKVRFKINNELLEYLRNSNNEILMKELFNDKNSLQNLISLSLGFILGEYPGPIYLPMYSDWRGRIYTKPFYITYQGNDVALALLEFMDGQKLTEDGLDSLYIYGANLYNEEDMGKNNYKERIDWVIKNKQQILDMKNKFINKAKNKINFISFCLTMRNLERDPNFLVKLPVFLDATCSGIQHLSAIIKDEFLGSQVNLSRQGPLDRPKDLYNKLLTPINNKIREVGKSDVKYSLLEKVQLNRANVKKAIMTKPYNVSVLGMKENIAETLTSILEVVEVIDNKDVKKRYYTVPTIDGGNIKITNLELYKIAHIIYNIIYSEYPTLEIVYDYFIQMAKLLSKLNLPITWVTPTGLNLVQEYRKSKVETIAISLAGKTRKLVIREKTNEIDHRKQQQSVIPNIIHSLDANHIYQIVLNNLNDTNFPIITVHDCFGTHPNNLKELTKKVKLEFIKLYSGEPFLINFHNLSLEIIKLNGYQIIHEDGEQFVMTTKNKYLKVPSIPKLGNLNLNDILDSQHFIT